jgi:hypothetical protein
MTHSRREWREKVRNAYKALRDAPEEHVDAAAEHASIGDEALAIMVDRTSSYGLVWQQYGALNNLVRAATKVDRLMETWWFHDDPSLIHKDALDDAFDAMNYLNFFIANARAGNITGTPPDRPKLSIVPDA